MFTANREGDWPRREIEQIAEQLQVLERQRRRAEVMGGVEYFGNDRGRVLIDTKWIEGGCRIGIEQGLTQCIGVDNPAVPLHAAIFAVTEPGFPVPGLKIISKLTQITFEPTGELVIIRCNLEGAQARLQSTVMDGGGELSPGRCSTCLRLREPRIKSSGRRVIRHSEWIEWVLNWYADAIAASDLEGVSCIRPYIRYKWSLRLRAIPESAHIFEVSKKLQVLVANFAVERAIEIFAVDRAHCRRESGVVKTPLLLPRKSVERHVLGVGPHIWKRVRRGC